MDARSPNPLALSRLLGEADRLRLDKTGSVAEMCQRYHDPVQLAWLRERMDERQWDVIVRYYALYGGHKQSYERIAPSLGVAPGMVQKVRERGLAALAWLLSTHEAWLLWQNPDEAVRMTAPVELLLEVDREHTIAPDGIMKSVVRSLRQASVENMHQLMVLGLHGLNDKRGFKHGASLQYLRIALEFLELIPREG